MVGNAKCGDIMQMFLKVNDDGIIEDVGFKTFGCGAAIATSSMATELIKGKSIDEALALTNSAVVEALEGLPPAKLHCSTALYLQKRPYTPLLTTIIRKRASLPPFK